MTQRAKDMLELVREFSDFINAPPAYEEQRMVRDYRHELWRKWLPLLDRLLPAPAAQADAPGGQDSPSSVEPARGDYSQTSQHRSGDLQPGSAEAAPGGLDAATVEACAKVAEGTS